MTSTFWDPQLVAQADSLNGDETCSPLEGLLTLTPAIAGTVTETKKTTDKTRRVFIEIPLQLEVGLFAQTSVLALPMKEPERYLAMEGLF
jgi:hypothetical protein